MPTVQAFVAHTPRFITAKEKGATKILSEEVYDWNVGFFLKNNYKIAGELKDLPKGHSYFTLEKDL